MKKKTQPDTSWLVKGNVIITREQIIQTAQTIVGQRLWDTINIGCEYTEDTINIGSYYTVRIQYKHRMRLRCGDTINIGSDYEHFSLM